MDAKTYSQLAIRTANDLGNTGDLVHGAMLVASEAGEIVDVFKKHFAYGRELDLVALTEEAGDLMWGINLVCKAMKTDFPSLVDVAHRGLNESDGASLDDPASRAMASLGMFYVSGIVAESTMDLLTASGDNDDVKFHEAAGRMFDGLIELVVATIYCLEECGLTVSQVFEANIAKLEKRYPDLRFNADHAANRDKAAELQAVEASIK